MRVSRLFTRVLFCATACTVFLCAATVDAAFWRSGLWVYQSRTPDDPFSVKFRVDRTNLYDLEIGGATIPCVDDFGSYDWNVTLDTTETEQFYINNGHIDGGFVVASGPYEGLGVFIAGDLQGSRGELTISFALNDNDMTHCDIVMTGLSVRRAGFFQRFFNFLPAQ
jgi:hypothetical protein